MQTQAVDKSPAPAVLDVRGLKTHFFTRNGVVKAVDGVDLTVAEGEILGLVGESGSGKSITGFSLMGLLDEPGRIVEGELRLNGEDLRGASPARWRQLRGQEIAMIFQDPMMTLNPVLRVDTQMIEAVQAHHKVSRDQARERALQTLTMVGIPSPQERLRTYPPVSYTHLDVYKRQARTNRSPTTWRRLPARPGRACRPCRTWRPDPWLR